MKERTSLRSRQRALSELAADAKTCKRCDLWRCGTQTVFGEGAAGAALMLIGEQPGDKEDQEGRPFVGPAGRLLHEALSAAGIDGDDLYVTNAVKHFKWTREGKRRIHERANREEILACRFWLDGEIAQVKPHAILALGATAAAVVAGSSVRVTRDRGRLLDSPLAPLVAVTVHPSSILRSPTSAARKAAFDAFVRDLTALRRQMSRRSR